LILLPRNTKHIQHTYYPEQQTQNIYREREIWNTRREIQIQTKLDQPPWKNGQHQTSETRPQLQT